MNLLVDLARRYLLPYQDPRRRRRMRRAAHALVTCEPWPEEAAGPVDVAQLALLRLLHLQREAHRTATFRAFEATMLLTRAAVETCIAGLYWLYSDDTTARMSGANAKAARRMMQFIADLDPLLPSALDDLVRLIGEPEDLPKLWHMAQTVAERTDVPLTVELYVRLYIPLSTLYEHPTGLALLRHIESTQLRATPYRIWSRRAALHTIDFCTSQVALAIAERTNARTVPFLSYAEAHMRRTPHPMVSMIGRRSLSGLKPSRVPAAIRAVASLRRSFRDGGFERATDEQRLMIAKRTLYVALSALQTDLPDDLRAQMIDRFALLLAQSASQTAPPDPAASTTNGTGEGEHG